MIVSFSCKNELFHRLNPHFGGGFEGGPVKFGRGVLNEFQAAWTMHGPRAGYGGGSGGGSRGKNTEISALEGGPDPPGPPIVGNPGVIDLFLLHEIVKTILFLRECVNRHACVMRENIEKCA